MANIADFKAQMIGGGARPNQFRVELTFPSYVTLGVVAGARAQFLCKAAQLPASTIETLPVLYRGRPVNFAGERTFQPWTVTVYNDTTFGIRNALEQWQSGIQNYNTTNGRTNPTDYQVDLSVHQLDRNGAIIKSYKFVDAFPTTISAIGLDYEQQNAIEQFDVEFQYNFFTSATGAASGFGVNVSIDTPVGSFPL
ncbi:tail tube protein [uncultured Caudovirales phage]|uniref:Tail tube protein n=1 Tax=uncultured Caudovirales phage TaxID=2100421 RepID=A0A6J5SCJ2_9CAUD|nr:tail tube protein [uncultured Caudovirales phage]CAB4182022.1 tail tube protein [uncultured Caudovirales phage]CAB4197275.1 tail tube protein [uncultured Caudovirales phage]CAB4211578.1 tail tube protein [uncultured Caudovirales phage]CAB5238691.1 tail tube protein [uncultured Caudovirales phage]